MITKSGLLSPTTRTAATPSSSHVTAPTLQTPTRQVNCNENVLPSPLVPSPSHLAHYLKYVETHLGVQHASTFESALQIQGIGPDILPEVDNKILSKLGTSAGDILHLKKGSMTWWNGLDAKRKRSNTTTSSSSAAVAREEPAYKKVSYEKRYHEGGGSWFSGPPMKRDEDDPDAAPIEHDYDLFYRCEIHKQWLPIPHGYSVDEDMDPFADAEE